ncbi:hypothetical protein ZIOFF_066357 [Zingiber officinale]|uniref:BED-type domain-containing protein n=1 Tax=Zingiber officinale TaxID=94328 RepID=A0A8J5K976_ZINOF|nr:hypothetical protein ZIOFF_066357 [Zingiber officinale]
MQIWLMLQIVVLYPYSIPARLSDPAWKYGIAVEGHCSTIICVICNKTIRGGGITRLKYHLAGIEGNVEAYTKVSDDVKWQMKQLINSLNKKQEQRKRLRNEIGGSSSASVNDREELVMDIPSSTLGGSSNLNARCSSQSGSKAKPQSFFPPRTTQGAQPMIRSALATKESVHNATMAMARWWYHANISFNAAKSNCYQPMVDAITSIGPGFKAPSYHDLRVIDARWDKQLHSPLHAAGCFLNPAIYFNPSFTKQKEVARGLLATITRLVPDDDVQDKISAQLEEYKASTGDFGLSIAIRQREKLNPVRERNLSKTKSSLDPISLDNIDLLEDWISEEPSLLDGEDLSWEMVDAPFASLSLDDDEEAPNFNDEGDNEGDDDIAHLYKILILPFMYLMMISSLFVYILNF